MRSRRTGPRPFSGERLGDRGRKAVRVPIEVVRGLRAARDHVVEEELSHRVPGEPLAPGIRLAPEIDGAVTFPHPAPGVRREPQARLTSIPPDVNRDAHLAAA